MKFLLTGSSGLIGSALAAHLRTAGHGVVCLARREGGGPGVFQWDPEAGTIDRNAFDGVYAVVHLAGENIARRRWTAQGKSAILRSRVQGTALLCETIASLRSRPRVLVSASAIGFYGDQGDRTLDEGDGRGAGFLANVTQQWEEAATEVAAVGVRVIRARFGMVLSARGGALARMATPFRFGLGGVIGNGQQYISWITLDDLVAATVHIILTESLTGPVNFVAPQPVTNREFSRALGRVLKRPVFLRMPAFAVRMIFGEMANDLLLASSRVAPTKLVSSGFAFRYPELSGALGHVWSEERET